MTTTTKTTIPTYSEFKTCGFRGTGGAGGANTAISVVGAGGDDVGAMFDCLLVEVVLTTQPSLTVGFEFDAVGSKEYRVVVDVAGIALAMEYGEPLAFMVDVSKRRGESPVIVVAMTMSSLVIMT